MLQEPKETVVGANDIAPKDPSHKVYAILVNSEWESGEKIFTEDEAEPH
jgi:hypothetical protein